MNVKKLKARMVLKDVSPSKMADAMGISEATFYRKMKADGCDFTQGEMCAAINVLELDQQMAYDIFFTNEVS